MLEKIAKILREKERDLLNFVRKQYGDSEVTYKTALALVDTNHIDNDLTEMYWQKRGF